MGRQDLDYPDATPLRIYEAGHGVIIYRGRVELRLDAARIMLREHRAHVTAHYNGGLRSASSAASILADELQAAIEGAEAWLKAQGVVELRPVPATNQSPEPPPEAA